jgi:trehalose 6-phosphate synthase/phosphatase
VLGIDSEMDQVDVEGRLVRLDALPIGIAPEEFAGVAERSHRVAGRLADLRRRFEGRRVLLAVDRLDYTKGIPERLRAYRRLLENAPDLREKTVLIQVAVPSRERIPEYEGLRREVNELVGAINGDFATPTWTPVVYLRRSMSRAELLALYEVADVGWVAPLRDGMNLVAKEFVACQTDGDAVLLLSEFAGAAAEMGEAFLVNPYDEDRTAATLERALGITLEERRDRMFALRRRVLRNNAFAWSERFIAHLRAAAEKRVLRHTEGPRLVPVDDLRASFLRSHVRWIFLAYDGSLVPLAMRPSEAIPTPSVLQLITELAALDSTHVAVVSSRGRTDLESWLGDVPGLWLVAEHAALLRSPSERRWEPLRSPMPVEWMERVRPILEHFVDRTPGSFIEEKECSLVWHHRMADPEFGAWLANDLAATLDEMLAETELRAVRGRKSIEVKPVWASKGEAVTRLAEIWPAADFRLAAGNDRSDEDLFERLGSEHWTIHVGTGPSRARFQLPGPDLVSSVLRSLTVPQSSS